MRFIACIAFSTALVFTAAASAQTSAPAAKAPAPAKAAPATSAGTSPSDVAAKTAKSKECSAQADQKGLHGKARKKFRDACKKA